MDWTMIGAVGEILGAGGVIITLAYLARQVRASTFQAKQAALREMHDLSAKWLGQLSTDSQVAHLWARGHRDPDALSEAERAQFHALLMQLVYIWGRVHHLDREGVSADYLRETRTVQAEIVTSPGFQAWFAVRKHYIDSEFRAVLEADMKRGGRYMPMGVDPDDG